MEAYRGGKNVKEFLSSPGESAYLWFSLPPSGLFSFQSIPLLLCGFLLTNSQTNKKGGEFSYQMYAKEVGNFLYIPQFCFVFLKFQYILKENVDWDSIEKRY